MNPFRFEMRFDGMPPQDWMTSFTQGKVVCVELGQAELDGEYTITKLEIEFKDRHPRFSTVMIFAKVKGL